MKNKEKKNKKIILIILLCVMVLSATVGGTIAWLTRTDKITNSFTVGTFNVPTTDPTDENVQIDIEGHLYEPSWNELEEHKIIPGSAFEKDPYVGIGTGSEDAVVYVYVENNFSDKVYFTINSGWEKVDAKAGYKTDTYTSGLFKYTANLVGSSNSDSWTLMPLFSEVVIDEDADSADLTVADGKNSEVVVSSFIHQAKDGDGNAIDANIIETAAKEAFGIN